MPVVINGTTGITNDGGYTGDGVVFADTTPANTLVTTTSGNVGIGTSSPSSFVSNGGLAIVGLFGTSSKALTIYNNSGANANNVARIDFKLNNTFSNNSTSAAIFGLNPDASANNGGALVFAVSANGTDTSPTEAMRIDSAGNVGIGTSTPSGRLHVNDNANRAEAASQFRVEGAGYTLFAFLDATAAHIGQNSNSRSLRIYSGSNSAVGVNLAAGGTSWGSYSDERLKTGLKPIENAVFKVSTLRAITGRYISDAETIRRAFLIAQDVQAVLPEAVDIGTDKDKTLFLKYTDTIPLLVAAIQEQQALITALTTRITALESN